MNISYVGDGQVYLLAGGGRCYSEMVAKFCRTEDTVEDIIASPYIKGLLKSLINSNHKAALEFDNFIFGIQGYARVTEVQLVRKRMASYMIKSGRVDKGGKRSYDVVIPQDIEGVKSISNLPIDKMVFNFFRYPITDANQVLRMNGYELLMDIQKNHFPDMDDTTPIMGNVQMEFDSNTILSILEDWYNSGVAQGYKEEDLRYLKPQATEFKAAIMMNGAGLKDWMSIRLCKRAQTEIRDLATKMWKAGMEAMPDMFEEFGPSCKVLGYCPEGKSQCEELKGKIPTRDEALTILRENYNKE